MKEIKQLLTRFGHANFLPMQEEAIEGLLNGQDVLLTSPTGGGKSLVYQLAALRLEGVAVIVCPLLSLMYQQVKRLKSLGIKAEYLNSTMNPGEQDDLAYSLRNGAVDLLFMAPEKLIQPSVIGLLDHTKVAFFAVDEAHCIVQWGQGFRPEYASLGVIRKTFVHVPIIAMTGSADELTKQSIIDTLSLKQTKILQQSANRANIHFSISQKRLAKKQLVNFIANQAFASSGIVYCRSRKGVEALSAWLNTQGIKSLFFNANISEQDKARNLKVFSQNQGIVMVATSAFGMGLDFSHVRFVVHMDLPNSLEAYYQEVGRAGRDGKPANALLLYGLQDVLNLLQFERDINQSSPDEWQRTINFCQVLEQRGCRRKNILAYFGEAISDCGNCDRCQHKAEELNLTIAAQKLLSLVYKTKGVISFGVMIQILLGKSTKAVEACAGESLSLFGKGKELNEIKWKALIRYLIANQFIGIHQFKPFQLFLHKKSKPLLQSKEHVVMNLDYFVPNVDVHPLSEYENQLLLWHSQCKQELLSVNIIKQLAQAKPKSLAAMSRLTGISIDQLETMLPPIYQEKTQVEYA